MGIRVREYAWHRSALGPLTRWPTNLRTATDLMLDVALPTLILAGGDGVVLYNDAFIPFLGPLHPTLLGTALSTARPETAARFHALAMAIRDGAPLITDDNWLGLPEEPDMRAASQLACAPLRGLKGEVIGIWAQMLASGARHREWPADEDTALPSLSAAGLAAWVWNPSAGELHLTDGARDALGLLPHEPHSLHSAYFDFVHPLDQSGRSAAIGQALTRGETYRSEFRIVRPCDQQMAWLEERGQIITDPATGHRILSTVIWETSDRKRLPARGEKPSKEQQRYAAALDIDTVGIAFFRAEGVITEANDTFCALHGVDKMDVLAGQVRWGDGTAREWLTLQRRSMYEYAATGRVQPHEKECVRPNGERWWGLFSAKRLSAEEGVGYVIDVSSRMVMEHELKDSERRTRALMEGIPQIVWRANERGQWTWTSPQWTELTGQPQSQSAELGWLDMVHPDDRAEARAICDRASWQQAFEANYRLWHIGENRYRTFKTRATPVRDDAGRIHEWLGTSTDVEDLQQLHARLRVLVAELQHRTRNLLALVRSIAAETIGHVAEDPRTQYAAFSERLAALSRAQSLVTRADAEYVDLESLLRAELAAMRNTEGSLVELQGPKVALPPSHAQTLALVTHELATNAVKYGALGKQAGELRISWRMEPGEAPGGTLHLLWRESGVSLPQDGPVRRGFGRELIEEALQFSLDAQTDLQFGADGVVCSIILPLSQLHPAA